MSRNTIFLIGVLILIGGGAYLWYRNQEPPLPKESLQTFPGELGERLNELRRLKDLKLDTSVFQDRFFQSLEAPTSLPSGLERPGTSTAPAGAGRANPFLPF